MNRRLVGTLLFTLLMGAATPVEVVRAAGPQTFGEGFLSSSSGTGGLSFSLAVDGQGRSYFELWDYSGDASRDLVLVDVSEATCLGDMFGGQTVRLTGSAVDHTEPGTELRMQTFLVDGGDAGPDRLSVKVQRADGTLVYFLPMRDLESGEVRVYCPD
jgi:hypothetical protein